MKKLGRDFAFISILSFGVSSLYGAQKSVPPAAQDSSPASAANSAVKGAAAADHASAYYHYMLARRYTELAGIMSRQDYVDKAVSEYKLAMQADPDSLFLRIQLASLYAQVSRVGEAVKEAEEVLKINPDYLDAHRLLGHIYLRNLSDSQPDKIAKESLRKAIEQYEALARLAPSDTESFLVLGRLYKANNEPAKAEEAFKKILNSSSDSRDALSNLAQLYTDQGEYTQAISILSKVPDGEMDGPLLGMLAYAYSQTQNFNKSAETFQKALERDPENQDIRRAYAEALMESGNEEAARGELQKILKGDAEDGQSELRLAQIDREEGHFKEARQELDRARTLMPNSAEIPFQQAMLEDAAGNDDKAIEIFQGLLKDSENPQGKYTVGEANNRAVFLERLGGIYRSQEKYDLAISTFRQVETLGSAQAPRAEGLIVETLRLARQPQKALQEAQAAAEKYPNDKALRTLRASLLGEQGHVDEAIQQLQSMLKGGIEDGDLYLSMAQIYSVAKRFPEAESMANKALGLSSKPEDQKEARFMLGSIYERQKKYDLSEEQFKQVLAVDPLNAQASNYLGYMLADRGVRLDESVKYIQKALQLDPNNYAYLDSLGWAYYKMRRFDLAEAPLEKAAHLDANDPTIMEHLGHLYNDMGKPVQAEQQWEHALREWPKAVGSDFDADQAAKLRKELDALKVKIAKGSAKSN